jgi:DNA-binding response OmpR family regulator/cellulose synthase/poly-beta-1,6-N-acetylglucosamine synthase-like glycosyltransferase
VVNVASGGGEPIGAASILVVDDDETVLVLVASALESLGYQVTTAEGAQEALARLEEATPDLVVSDVSMPDMTGFEFIERLRSSRRGRTIPFIFLTARDASEDVVTGLALGADDYLRKPFELPELVARVQAKLERRPVPQELLAVDLRTGLLTRLAFGSELQREAARAERTQRPGHVAVITFAETRLIRDRLGARAAAELEHQLVGLIQAGADPLESIGIGDRNEFLLLLPECSAAQAHERLHRLARTVAGTTFTAAGERLRLTPAIGHARISPPADAIDHAATAADDAATHLDLAPRAWTPAMEAARARTAQRQGRQLASRLRLPLQLLVTLIPLVVPFFVYLALYRVGVELASVTYLIVAGALFMTATLIWIEGIAALGAPSPPAEPGAPYPSAAAIIAAYLPNEAATILATVGAFLRIDYPADLRVILAYNTPGDLAIEQELRELARRDPCFTPLRVDNSTSKAQNVNAALAHVTGEFVGIFDADHQPHPDSFRRAWRWLSNGYDVVQGHCLVRNGDASSVARTVAVEFEVIYAVSHPGRARLHGFGIFGGSNGFWRTQLLAETRMRGWMLTEDIDSSMRVIENGYRIASDRGLISRELAPATLTALWNQRMRWAQGWFQVSKHHAWRGFRSPRLSLRNKLGLGYLLLWREVYPWISLQMFPIIAYYSYRAGSPGRLNWLVPVLVLTTLFTFSSGPSQTLFAYLLAAPEVRRRKNWFLLYLLVSSVFYSEFKNTISRVAQVKELMREQTWRITPRASRRTASTG